MLKSFRVRNLRAIADSGDVHLSKINVVVGKNSAGKSTLLRVLPLLRQSVEQPTKGPLLWYGRYVDFGSFQNAINSANKSEGIEFSFNLNLPGTTRSASSPDSGIFASSSESARFYKGLPNVRVNLVVGADEHDDVGRLRRVYVNLGADSIEVRYTRGGVSEVLVNSQTIPLSSDRKWFVQVGKVLSIPFVGKEEAFEERGTERKYWTHEVRPFADRLVQSLVPYFHGNTSVEKIAEFSSGLLYAGEGAFFDQLKSLSHVSSSFASNVANFTARSSFVTNVRVNVLLKSLTGIFRRVDQEIGDFASTVKYVEPVRATAERYYRLQDLAVDEIDSRGENTAMFLNSLTSYELRLLRVWMERHLGFFAYVEQGSGHVQVKIGTESDDGKNIADLGFGYSQLLPIILQLWRSIVHPPSSSMRADTRPVLAIEQPELHLHPQFQAQIADVLCAVMGVDSRRSESSIFVETHSEHIINRLGHLIAIGRLSQSDVQVLVVESESDAVSVVRKVGFTKEGFLDANWPAGFFVPEFSQ